MLQGELWTKRLATEVGIEWDTCLALWAALVEQLEQRLTEGQCLDWTPLGQWYSFIAPEFVADTEQGLFLAPPRVALSIVQNRSDALPIVELLPSLEHRTGICPDIISKWLEHIPLLALTLLDAGHSIVWDRLGSWTRVEKGLSFLPSSEFMESLNRPFSAFGIEVVHTDTLGLDLERRTIALEEITRIDALLLEKRDKEPEFAADALDETLFVGDVPTVFSPSATIPNEPKSEPQEQPRAESREPENKSNRKGLVWFYPLLLFLLLLAAWGLFRHYQLLGLATTKEQKESSLDTIQSELVPDTVPTITKTRLNYKDSVAVLAKDSSLSLKVENRAISHEAADKKTQAKDSLKPVSKPAVESPSKDKRSLYIEKSRLPEATTQKPKQEQSGATTRAELREEVKIGVDESLAVLSQRKYGHRAFWVYIYEENRERIANPHRVPIGTSIILPPASKYGIDKDNNKSLQQALVLGRNL